MKRGSKIAVPAGLLAGLLLPPLAAGAEIVVAPSGGDYATITEALAAAQAGDTVTVLSGAYPEALVFPRSGSAAGGYITLRAGPGETVTVDPNADTDVISIENRSYLKIIGLDLTNSAALSDASAVRVSGWADHIEIRDNIMHGLRGTNAMGITVYGTSATPVSEIVVVGNQVRDCEPAPSEAVVLNGNVTGFLVADNIVRDVNNIGIDFIGGESWTGNHGVAREGVCRGNRVYRARSGYGGGYAAGIYVDGGRDIIVEQNSVHQCDLGIEIGAENAGWDVTGVIVRNNIVFDNDKAGILFGGYEESLGRVNGCEFSGNTLCRNDTLKDGNGEFAVNWAGGNRVRNNIVWAGPQNLLLRAGIGSVNNAFDHNLYYAAAGPAGAAFDWRETLYAGFENYRTGTGQDADSLFADPLLEDPDRGEFRLQAGSPAINAGDTTIPDLLGEYDYYGDPRIREGTVDIGADERGAAAGKGSGDYDGDGTSDVALFRPSTGLWLIRNLTRAYFGASTDIPVPQDYSGDGTWNFAVYRASQSKWMARGVTTAWFGKAVDIPVPADYDGDGRADCAVFRPSVGKWAVRGVTQAYYGVSSDSLVPGNYALDPRARIAVWRPSTGRWLVKDLTTLYYGGPTDGPVPGPYSGGLTWDYAVYRYSQGKWLIRGLTQIYYGNSTDTVQGADYDGDGTFDFGVFRSSAGRWMIKGVTSAYYGASSDLPVTNP